MNVDDYQVANLIINFLTSAGTVAAAFLAFFTVINSLKQSQVQEASRKRERETEKIKQQADLVHKAAEMWDKNGGGDDYLFGAYFIMKDLKWPVSDWDHMQAVARKLSTNKRSIPSDKELLSIKINDMITHERASELWRKVHGVK